MRPVDIRILTSADQSEFERFLAAHRDSSMLLRANARRAGLVYHGQPFQATHAAAFRGSSIVGIAAHCWNGMLLLQAPEEPEALARAGVEWSGRPVAGLIGPSEQVARARAALHLLDTGEASHGSEWLYAIDLSDLVVPATLLNGTLTCRPPREHERDMLHSWRLAYDIETLNAVDSPEQRKNSAEFLDGQIADGHAWVACEADVPVSLSALNASLPDIVQLGGIYTPPPLRGRGYARVSVAGTLLAMHEQGVSRAVLFTGNPSAARSYEGVGFRRVGDYSLVILR